jgi:ketosteroid isomerase-like protein
VASANLEFVRSLYAAFERGDWTSAEWAHPDIETVIADGPDPGSWTGIAAMAEGWRSFLSAWEEFRVEAEEYRELDEERVLVLIRKGGRGKASGLELEQMPPRQAHLLHIHDGKVTRQVFYFERERALTDLGLDPEAGSQDT